MWPKRDVGPQPLKAQIINVQAIKAALGLDPEPVTAQIDWAQISEALKTDDEPPYFNWSDPDIYELVGRPVTRADYEGTRGEDSVSRQGPAT